MDGRIGNADAEDHIASTTAAAPAGGSAIVWQLIVPLSIATEQRSSDDMTSARRDQQHH